MIYHKQSRLILCLAAVLILPAEAKQPASVSAGDQGLEILRIIVIDVSSSMSQTDGTAISRVETARREIQQALIQLPASDKTPVILVPFSDQVRSGFDHIYTDPKELNGAIAKLQPDGHTNIAAGLSRSIEWATRLSSAPHLVTFLYSDGEHNVGSMATVIEQEERLDKLFGLRASKGLSQTVVVKRWGGVIGSIVARLQKNPNVAVIDAGELELRTITLVPSVKIRDVRWHNAESCIAGIQMDVTVASPRTSMLPFQANLAVACPIAESRWLGRSSVTVNSTETITLLAKLDLQKFSPTQRYALPLQFSGPSQVKTDKGIIFIMIAPQQIWCELPTGLLRPQLAVSAELRERGSPRWQDLQNRIAVWPMRLRMEAASKMPILWSEQIKWDIRGLGEAQISTDRPILMQGRNADVNVDVAVKVPLDKIARNEPVAVRVQLKTLSAPKTVSLSSMEILLAVRMKLPELQSTRIKQAISGIGTPQWSDLTAGLVTVPVKLDIELDGMIAPKTVLGLVPCNDVVDVSGVPVTLHAGQQTVDITLTGRVRSAGVATKWTLQLKPPPPTLGIRYVEPPPVEVGFVAPGPVQAVLCGDRGILNHYSCRGGKPDRPIAGRACVGLAGPLIGDGAAKNLRITGLLQGPVGGNGFSGVGPGQSVSWSMKPSDPASCVKWWRDTVVQGSLVLLPENAARDIVLGHNLTTTILYEATYKKLLFYLAVGLAAVLLGTLLFWMLKTAVEGTNRRQ
ncbi:MAG: VWA domain-containing protein [Sedimentisphaerales bacterium]|nr:VWA domain-containing protein [Sedimentisphaerales bacterium]